MGARKQLLEYVKMLEEPELHCANWQIEGALRMLLNVVHPEVAKDPDNLIVYGGTGKAARNWDCFVAIVETLLELKPNETLLIQSGKPVAVFETHTWAPRVLMANSLLVPKWATWDYFLELEQKGLIMYGQMTAGSWAYIGTQGILQGTYETLAAVAEKHFGGSLRGRLVLTAGCGEMGGAQPLAVTMNEGVCLIVEVDCNALERRMRTKYLDEWVEDLDEALEIVKNCLDEKKPHSVGVLANAAETHPYLVEKGVIPDVLTDQTAAHDLLRGYYPAGYSKEEADELRESNPEKYLEEARKSVKEHVRAMVQMMREGAVTFEYGNNIREQAYLAGFRDAFTFPGFVQAYIRPLFCEGRGPFRWTSLMNRPEDIYRLDDLICELFPENTSLIRWIKKAREKVKFQGLPARVCWLGYGERAKAGVAFNKLVARGEIGPIWIGRDHLDAGSVASPRRETEGMKDGSDAIADWPILNALLNAVAGATWVAVHHGGGVGIGYSIHAGMCVVADGTKEAEIRLKRVLTTDPGLGIVRHADAGYRKAIEVARRHRIKMPMLEREQRKPEEAPR